MKLNNRKLRIILLIAIIFLLFVPMTKATGLQVKTLDYNNITDYQIRDDGVVDTIGSQLRIGDQATNNSVWKTVVKINSSNLTIDPSKIVSVLLKYNIWQLNNPYPMGGIVANYSQNDTWDSPTIMLPSDSNNSDYVIRWNFVPNTAIKFDITKEFIADYSNTSDRLHTIILEPYSTSANGVSNNIRLWSAQRTNKTLAPLVEIYYDNNASGYASPMTYNYTNVINGVPQTFYNNYFLIYVTTDNGSYGIQANSLPAGTISYSIGNINDSDKPSGTIFPIFTFGSASDSLSFSNNFNDNLFFKETNGLIIDTKRAVNKSYYLNGSNNKFQLDFGTLGRPHLVGRSNDSNVEIEDTLGGRANTSGLEDVGIISSGFLSGPDKIIRNVTGGLYVNEFIRTDTTGSKRLVGTAKDKEFWIGFDTPEMYGFLMYLDFNDSFDDDTSTGMVVLKSTGEQIYFSKVAGLMTTYNDSDDDMRTPVNWTMYANETNKGTLVLNAVGFARGINQHIWANVTGQFIEGDGSVVSLSSGTAVMEYFFTPRIYLKELNNAYLFHERYTKGIGMNITISPIDISQNVTLSFNNTNKPFFGGITNVIDSSNLTLNFSQLIYNETTYIQANMTVDSDSVFNVTINNYNLSGINFTVSNSTIGQTMNITLFNDSFPIKNGISYQIKKNGEVKQISIGNVNNVTFTNISVGSDYQIEHYVAPTPTINFFYDSFDNNVLNTSYWDNATTGTASLTNTNGKIKIVEDSNDDGAYIVTKDSYDDYNVSIDINYTAIASGFTGMYIFSKNKSASFTNTSKAGIQSFQSSGKLLMFYFNRSGTPMYWNSVSSQWQTGIVGLTELVKYRFNFTVERNFTDNRTDSNYRFTIKNSTTGAVLEQSGWVSAYDILNGGYDDYIAFGDASTTASNQNLMLDNFTIYWNASTWKGYPYEDLFVFEHDEGFHSGATKEWVYGNANLSGNGKHYGLMWSYNKPSLKIFDLINLTNGNGTPVIDYQSNAGVPNASTTFMNVSYAEGADYDKLTRTDPFNYSYVGGVGDINVSLTYSANNAPILPANASKGCVNMGIGGLSAYYAITNLSVNGTICDEGTCIAVSGYGWMEHQWGSWNVAGYDGWDWYPFQLSNGKDFEMSKMFRHDNVDAVVSPLYSIDYGTEDNYTSNTSYGGFIIDEFAYYYNDAGDIRTNGVNITIFNENISVRLTPYNLSEYGFEIPRILKGTWGTEAIHGTTFIEANHRWNAIRRDNFTVSHKGQIDAVIPVNYSNGNNVYILNSTEMSWINRMSNDKSNITLYGTLNGVSNVTRLNMTILPNTEFINVTINNYNSTVVNFTASNSTYGQTMNVTVFNDTFKITNGANYQIKKDGVVKQIVTGNINNISFTNISVGSDYQVE